MFEVFTPRGGRFYTDSQYEAALFASIPGYTVFAWPPQVCGRSWSS